MGKFMLRIGSLLCLLAIVFSLAGCLACLGVTYDFFTPKGTKMAVIAGMDNELTKYAANSLTEELKVSTIFKVTEQRYIKTLIPDYPIRIKGAYDDTGGELKETFAKTDMAALKKIAAKTGCDYLIVLWIPGVYSSTSVQSAGYGYVQVKTDYLPFVSQLFEFPAGKDIGHSISQEEINTGGKKLIIGAKKGETPEETIDLGAERYAKMIATLSKMEKK